MLLFFAAALVGCNSTSQSENDEVISARQGKEVSQICFASNIDGWKELEGETKALILTKSLNEEYKVELSGFCNTRNAMFGIATKTRSSCLMKGDEIIMSDGLSGRDSCRILKIYEWLPSLKTDEVALKHE